MYRKNTAGQFICFQGVDATTGGIKSGVTWTMRRSIDGTFAAGGGTVTEDGTAGWYKCALTQADTNGNNISFNFTGSGAVPQTVNIITDGSPPDVNLKNAAGTAVTLDANNVLNVSTKYVAGTAQTARDIGASVLLSSGTGTGQLSLSSGLVTLAGVTHTGAVIPTVTTVTNQLTAAAIATGVWTDTTASDFTTALSVGKSVMNGVSLGTGLTVAAVSGAVGSVTGAVGSVTGAVGSVTGAVGSVTGNVGGNVVGSVASVTARVTANTDQLAGQTVTAAAGVTFPTSVASPTNITAGTITTTTNLTNAPTAGDFTTTMKTSIGTAVAASAVASVTAGVTVTTNNDKTGYSVGTGGITSSSFAAGAIDAASIAANAIGASELAQDAAQEIADEILNRNIAGSGSGDTRNVRNALRAIRNKVAIAAGTLTVYQEDDSTSAWTATVATTAGDPLSSIDPA